DNMKSSLLFLFSDNAYDPDVTAKQFWIDKTMIKGQDCLTFTDNGAGMDYDKMYKMLSFGFNDKQTVNGHVPVGIYGNGFKSGSMRLGKDAIVFSKNEDSMCVGLLSQTYLEQIKAEHVIHAASLQDILRYSLFQTEDQLLCEIKAINSPSSTNSTGTRIIIWNLRKSSSEQLEFDFSSDRYDIRIPADVYESTKKQYKKPEHVMQSGPESDYSLRAYCSVLYLKPRMHIIIRGQKVRTELISKSLAYIFKDKYRPKIPNIVSFYQPIPITFGYNTKSKEQYGIMMYHKNRLIKAYERVTCQLKANNTGVGVIGVIECNFLKPTHNKQDFDYTEEYRETMYNLNIKLEDYWKDVHHRFQKQLEIPIPVEEILKWPDQNWAQCDDCLQWRKLPDGIDTKKLPEKWFCHLNPDPQFRCVSCVVPEQPEDSDHEEVYQKTYKQQKQPDQNWVQCDNCLQWRKIPDCIDAKKLPDKWFCHLNPDPQFRCVSCVVPEQPEDSDHEEVYQKTYKQHDRSEKLKQAQSRQQTTSPRSPTQATPNSKPNSSHLRPADSRFSDSMPVISSVTSLSTTPSRVKRSLDLRAKTSVEKRPRLLSGTTPGSPSPSTASQEACASPSVFMSDDSDGGTDAQKGASADNDDDIFVIESNSTPKPSLSNFDFSIVKSERCNDDIDMDTSVATENTVAATLPPPGGQACSTTQTKPMQVMKQEVEHSEGKEEVERGTCQSETEQGLLPLERSTNQEQEIKSVTSLGKENGDVNESHSTSEVTDQTLDSCTVKLELQEDEPRCHQMSQLLEATTRERDEYQAQVHLLTSRVEELERSLQEQTEKAGKKQESEQEYKALYLQAQGEMEQFRHELEKLKREKAQAGVVNKGEGQEGGAGEGAQSDGGTAVPDVDDELACQVDFLMRELDQRTKQKGELENRLKNLKDENSFLLTCCEGLQKDLEEMNRDRERVRLSVEDGGSQTDFPHHNQDDNGMAPAGPSNPGRASQGDPQGGPETESGQGDTTQTCNLKLRELRQNVTHLLVNFVPALDLQQVNFDCDVIDEILAQVLDLISSPLAAGQSS
ncbi:hypothetical protein P4O66_008144, partial [Electrophorus voltai]